MAVFFGLATFLALRRFVENGSWLNAVIFWICVCLGFLSHLTYLHVFIACAAWLIIHLLRTSGNKRHTITSFAKCFAVPMVFLSCFYIFALRGVAIGGGPDYRLYDILLETLSYTAGGILAGPLAVVTGVVVLGLLLWAIIHLWQKGRSEWVFYLFVVFLSPGAILLLGHHPVMFVRYFLISIAFGLVAVSYLLANLYRRGRAARIFVAIILDNRRCKCNCS